ncbi:hypothetical protein N489_09685 [Lactococcus lactis subsp. lactis 1AA59]|nr:hypothetical protein N489_09685 [Lactococcus lactis subsp. lactis 1AA59]
MKNTNKASQYERQLFDSYRNLKVDSWKSSACMEHL